MKPQVAHLLEAAFGVGALAALSLAWKFRTWTAKPRLSKIAARLNKTPEQVQRRLRILTSLLVGYAVILAVGVVWLMARY